MSKPEPILWLNDARGVYIPRDFAKCFIDRFTRDEHVAGVTAEDWLILETGPDHDLYWDAWDDVLNNATMTDEHGVKFTLHQDGDLWLVPEGMEWSEEQDCYVWPETEEGE